MVNNPLRSNSNYLSSIIELLHVIPINVSVALASILSCWQDILWTLTYLGGLFSDLQVDKHSTRQS